MDKILHARHRLVSMLLLAAAISSYAIEVKPPSPELKQRIQSS